MFRLPVLALTALACSLGAIASSSLSVEYHPVTISGGGFITGFLAHPTQKDLIYARTDIGGTYRWNAKAWTWEPITDFVLNNPLSGNGTNLLGTESIALDPTDPKRLYLAQGMYAVWDPWAAFFASDDQGKTFKQYRSPVPMGANDMGRNGGERLVVNPHSPNELWFGSRTEGLWRSVDRAATWSNITSFPDAYGNGIGLISVIFDPNNNGTAYVGACVPGGLYVTHDGGVSWAQIDGQPTTWSDWTNSIVSGTGTATQSTGPQPIKVALNNNKLYITYADAPGPWGVLYGEVHSYDVSSKTWADITPSRKGANTTPAPSGSTTTVPGGWNGITFGNNGTVVVSTLDANAADSVYLSRDGGNSWKDLGQLATPTGAGGTSHTLWQTRMRDRTLVPWLSFADPGKGILGFGWWIAAVLIDPFNQDRLLYGTGATIWATDTLSRADADQSPSWYINSEGMEEAAVWVLKSPPSGPANLFSGMYDLGGFRHDDLTVPQPMYNWPTYSSTDGLDFAGKVPNVLARVGRNDNWATDSVYGCAWGAVTTDAGDHWNLFPTCPPVVNSTAVPGNGGTVAVGADGKTFVWSPYDYNNVLGTGPYASSDGGKTWTVPTGLTFQTTGLAADRVKANVFYAYAQGNFYVSVDGGLTYSQTGSGLPTGWTWSGTPIASYLRAGELWVSVTGVGIYHSTDFGATFTALPNLASSLQPSVFGIGAPKTASGAETLFFWGIPAASKPEGLYMSTDNGASWLRVNDDQHQYGGPVSLSGDPRVFGRVYFGMNGRGIMYAQVTNVPKNKHRRRH